MGPSKVWTTELHVAFLDAVNALGGPTLAKPKKKKERKKERKNTPLGVD